MKYTHRILSLMLAVVLIASLCAACAPANEAVISGRYVETDITPPGLEGSFHSFVLNDGTLVCYDNALAVRYESKDNGSTWQETAGPGADNDRYANAQNAALLESGELLVFIGGEGIFRVSADGAETAVAIEEIDNLVAEGQFPMFTVFKALPGDRLLISYMAGMFQITQEETAEGESGGQVTVRGGPQQGPVTSSGPDLESSGSEGSDSEGPSTSGPSGAMISDDTTAALYDLSNGKKIADVSGGSGAAATDSTLYVTDNANRVAAYNLADGAAVSDETRTLPAGEEGGMGMRMTMIGGQGTPMDADTDGTIYFVDSNGLQQISASGEVIQLLESGACSLGSPNASAQFLAKVDDGCFVVSTSEGTSGRLYKYEWDANATLDPNKTIKIWSLEENDVVRAAINAFRAKHPDAIIQYEIALGNDSAASAEDAIKNLNTRLLNDDGPDVIILDGCPAQTYINEGILLDLSSALNTGDVYGEVLNAFGTDGLYAIPTQFSLPVLMGAADDLAANQTLEQLVQNAVNGNDAAPMTPGASGDPFANLSKEDRAALGFSSFDEAFELLWKTCAPAIVTDGGIDREALSSFMSALQALSDKYELAAENEEEGRQNVAAFSAGGGRAFRINNGIMMYMMQRTVLGADTLSNIMFLQLISGDGAIEGTEIVSFPGLAEGVWIPSSIAGVNADSGVPELATEFVAAMLSDTVQGAGYGAGFPVTRQGFALQIADINERLAENGEDPFVFDFDALVSQMKTPSVSEQVVTDAVKEAALACCKNELDVEGAVTKIEQNLKNYLAERA